MLSTWTPIPSSQHPHDVGIIIPVMQTRKLRRRWIKGSSRSGTQSQGSAFRPHALSDHSTGPHGTPELRLPPLQGKEATGCRREVSKHTVKQVRT